MDEEGRLDLGAVRSLRDLATHTSEIKEAMMGLLTVQDEFEVAATLVFDARYARWLGIPDEKTMRYLEKS